MVIETHDLAAAVAAIAAFARLFAGHRHFAVTSFASNATLFDAVMSSPVSVSGAEPGRLAERGELTCR